MSLTLRYGTDYIPNPTMLKQPHWKVCSQQVWWIQLATCPLPFWTYILQSSTQSVPMQLEQVGKGGWMLGWVSHDPLLLYAGPAKLKTMALWLGGQSYIAVTLSFSNRGFVVLVVTNSLRTKVSLGKGP